MLDLRSLRHLVVLAQRLNFGRAADELGITQPTLSRSIQALESRLGTRLFDRDRGKVSLTPQGQMIAERAQLLLMDAEELERDAVNYGQAERGRIRFGMAPMPARALLSGMISDRLNAAPSVTNEVVVRDVEALWDMLIAGEIEFFVSPNPPLHDLSRVRAEVLDAFPLSLIVRAGHPLLNDAPAEMKFPLLRSSWSGVPVPEEIRRRISGTPNVIEDFAALAGITASTDAIWLSSAYAVQDELRAGTLIELFRAPQQIDVVLYALKRRSRSPLAAALGAALREHVQRLEHAPQRR